MKTKPGFIFKQVLLLLMTLFTFIIYTQTYHQYYLKNLSYHLELEKQKVVELILYSYFINHDRNETKQMSTSEVDLAYTMTAQEKTKELKARICIESCYYWTLTQDKETKQITNNAYSLTE